MNTTYTYSITADTLNGILNSSRLHKEINDSDILIALIGVNVSGDVIDIVFKGNISTLEETNLGILLAAHTGESYKEAQKFEFASDVLKTQPELAHGGPSLAGRGINFVALAGVETSEDYLFTEDLTLKEAFLKAENLHAKDHITALLVDTNNVLGYGAGAPIHYYAKNWPMPKSGEYFMNNNAVTALNMNTFTMRVTYKSHGTEDVCVGIGLVCYTTI